MDNPHRFLLEICRNHLNNMTLNANTAISQFGLSIGISVGTFLPAEEKPSGRNTFCPGGRNTFLP